MTHIWLHWRGGPDRILQNHENWSRAMSLYGNAQGISSVNFGDMAYVLVRSKGVRRNGLLVARHIWWGLNDRYRYRYRRRADCPPLLDIPKWPVGLERANKEVTLSMLQDSDGQPRQLIQQVELLRLLGRFGEAVTVLRDVSSDAYSEVSAAKIETLAIGGDTQVRI